MIDVAIIGAGPTGLLLANLLGRRGVETLVLEKQPTPYRLPRAIHFDGEAMRVFQSAGLADRILPQTMVGRGMLFKDAKGTTLVDWSRDPDIGPMGWRESYRFHQPDLEQTLIDGLDRFDHVTLRRGAEVARIEGGDAARLTLASGEQVEARYAIGCDGAESPTRAAIGEGVEDLGFHETWLVLDLILKRPRPDLGDHSVQFCDPEAPATYVRGVGDRRRWEMRLERGYTPDEADIWRRLARWVTPDDAEIERSAVYTFRSRLARKWRDGPLLIAGDAAHQTPPFMGQGMCAGVRDAANLAWKLTLALQGTDVLDSYQSERSPNARQFIELSVRLGKLINQTAAGEAPKGRMHSIWPALGPGLGPRDEIAGALSPQPFLGEARADDVAEGRFYAIVREDVPATIPVFNAATDWLAEHDLFAAIARPDGYALASATTPEDLAAHLATHAALFELPAFSHR